MKRVGYVVFRKHANKIIEVSCQ